MLAVLLTAILVLAAATAQPAAAASWAPIEPSDLSAKKALTDPEADAEAVFWEIRVVDELTDSGIHSDVSNYLRLKIFTDRGVEAYGRVDIPYEASTDLMGVDARVIRSDGSIIEINRKSMFDRPILKGSGRKVNAKSFAIPDLKPGTMVEYRWTQRRYGELAHYLRIPLQMAVPVRIVTLWVKPLLVPTLQTQFRVRSFNAGTPHFEEDAGGMRKTAFPSMPAFRTEPRMPPENSVRRSLLFSYEWKYASTPEAAWAEFAKLSRESRQDLWRVDDSIRRKAREIAGVSGDEGQRLALLYDFCRTQIRDIDDDVHAMTDEDKRKVKTGRNAAETLRRGMGTALDIDYLFAALASAAGFTTRIALLPDRSLDFFDSRQATPMMLTQTCVAVQTSNGWRFFDPGARYIPPGSLPWWEEGVEALLLEKGNVQFVSTPMAPPAASLGKRRGTFSVSAEGALEGDVRTEYTGHWGAGIKDDTDESTDAERATSITKSLQSRLSGAEVTQVRVEHASDPDGVYSVSYHVRVPGYATPAGRRLILDPAYFEHGTDPEFGSSRRTHPVYFSYPWAEDDSIVIRYPEGFEAESVPALAPYTISGIAEHTTELATSIDGGTLVYRRRFEFGREGAIYFPLDEYPRLKQAFDTFEERNHQTLVLIRKGTSP